jgi:predicted porin
MNKKLLALAVASACVAPSVMAQSANPVTLYGRVYVTVESVKADNGPPGVADVANKTQVSDNSSLLGVRGTEDIGGGNKIFFQLETAFDPQGGGNTFATRNSAVGIQGHWGNLLVGRWDSPYKVLGYGPDVYGDLNLGGITAALHGGAWGAGSADLRMQNVLQYWTPKMAGFQVKLAQTSNEGKTDTLNPYQNAVSLTWAGHGLNLGYGHEEHKDVSATFRKVKGDEFTGTWDIASFKLGLIYEELTATTISKQKNWLASILWTAGKHQFAYQYMNSDGGGADTLSTQPSCDVNSLGYFYNWSKRSQLVATYVKVDNSDGGRCKFGANDVGSAGQDREGFGIGIKHVF